MLVEIRKEKQDQRVRYQKRGFWEENPIFAFDTLYEYREYEVFAALKTRAPIQLSYG